MTSTKDDLDASQRTVVSVSVDGRQIVLAGPGAGKTEAVSRLAERFVRDGVYPDEILIISFSRAALLATTQRTQHIVDEGHGVTITTIDSLATRIVLEADDNPQGFRGFDDTVSRATAVLAEAGWNLESVAHVVIDEVQDVVGLRAHFLLRLLEVLVDQGAGCTLLGDPLQGIYDFQLGGDTMTCNRLLEEVRRSFSPEEHTLTGEHRTRSIQARAAAAQRSTLASMQPDERLRALTAITVDIPPLGTVDADAFDDIAAWRGTTAFLTDTNIRAALLAQEAAGLGFGVALVPSRDDTRVPAWIANLLQHYPHSSVSRQQFLDLHHDGLGTARWRLLMRMSRGRRDLLLRDLGDALQSFGRLRELSESPTDQICASTVHRAKWLEFDNIALVDSNGWDLGPDVSADAASRRLFVALTRARHQISRIRGIDTRGWSCQKLAGTAAWVKRQPRRGGRGRAIAVLMQPWMARALGPAIDGLDIVAGATVTWRRVEEHSTVDGAPVPSWTAYVDETPVARTGEVFGQIVAQLTDPSLLRLPALEGGYLEGLETVAGPPAPPDGPGRHGFWASARVVGSVCFVWN